MINNNQMAFNLSVNDVYSVDWVYSAKYTKDWKTKFMYPRPPASYIREVLDYDYSTGKLYWKMRNGKHKGISSFNRKFAGKETSTKSGQIAIKYDGKYYNTYIHHLVWCWVYGEWADQDLVIDHINGNNKDNRKENLRLVTHAENQKNRSTPSNNSSGHIGVYWSKRDQVYFSQININGKLTFLGNFKNKKDAIAARKAAEIENGYHENHGRIIDEDA